MAQDDKPDSMDNKVDALAAMAGGEDLSRQGFNAVEQAPPPATATPVASGSGTSSASGARKSRASALQRQRSRVHAEQFKRMMVPILVVTGALLMVLGGIVGYMMRPGGPLTPLPGDEMVADMGFKKIMVGASFVIGAILLVGAWMFRMDLKRAEAADQRENEKNKDTED